MFADARAASNLQQTKMLPKTEGNPVAIKTCAFVEYVERPRSADQNDSLVLA